MVVHHFQLALIFNSNSGALRCINKESGNGNGKDVTHLP